MVKLLKPVIERRWDEVSSGLWTRKWKAEAICRFLKASPVAARYMSSERERYYLYCEDLLNDSDSERILLYLPLTLLKDAPASFRSAYMRAWGRLLRVKDVRENFHTGDCFELDARPSRGLERVVKCVHLTPWLLKYGYIAGWELLDIIRDSRGDQVLLQGFSDIFGYICENKLLSDVGLREFASMIAYLPGRKKQEPLYTSKKRLEWLGERNKPVELLTPSAKLEGPFSGNIPDIAIKLEEVAANLRPSEIVLVGGSTLKGYGTTNSDLDKWALRELEADEFLRPGSVNAAHIYFNTIWLGIDAAEDSLEQAADRITHIYADSAKHDRKARCQILERLESDLIQYRLLHKGFSRVTGETEFHIPLEMDGDCPFYCDEYRRIATMLYVKYVWL